jgi:hypothetical protein
MRYALRLIARANERETVYVTFSEEWAWDVLFTFAETEMRVRHAGGQACEYVFDFRAVVLSRLPDLSALRQLSRYADVLETMIVVIAPQAPLKTMIAVFRHLRPDVSRRIRLVDHESEAEACLAAYDAALAAHSMPHAAPPT